MRRWRVLLAAVTVAAGLAGAVLGVWVVSSPGFLAPDRTTTDRQEIAAMAASDLGLSGLPAGVDPVAAREGGFQDRFVQIRLDATQAGFDRLLSRLALTSGELIEDPAPYLGPPDTVVLEGITGPMRAARLPSPRLDHLILAALLAAGPDPQSPDTWQVLLWGFDT